jgi:ribosomal protein S18 acetylase RimI-like enzyme
LFRSNQDGHEFMHPLDNVIWQALTTRQTTFAESHDQARRFVREVTSLAGFLEPSERGYASLSELIGAGGTAGLFLSDPYVPQPGWTLVAGTRLLQMVCETTADFARDPRHADPEILELGPADSPEMIELTTLTKPGPFGPRTHELGTYLGIRIAGKLAAMAGERLKVRGFTEVSAVCTHPDHTGHGYAATLMLEVMRGMRSRGETPFLHVREDNLRAIALYERLGFSVRTKPHLAVLRKD